MKNIFLVIIGISSIILISVFVVVWSEYGMVCNNAVTKHLQKHSNLFNENITHETYGINNIGLPFGVHPGNLQECVDHTLEQHTAMDLLK